MSNTPELLRPLSTFGGDGEQVQTLRPTMHATGPWCPCLLSEDIRSIYDHLWKPMVATAQGVLHDRAEGEEIAQEAMVRIAERYCEFRGSGSVEAWAKSITRRLALNRQRESSRRRNRQIIAVEERPSPADPEGVAMSRERVDRLAKALDSLPPDAARVLRLRIVEQRSLQEIARDEEMPVGTVMSRLARARERLKLLTAP